MKRRPRLVLTVAALLAAAPLAAGCGAGQNAVTANEHTAIDGSNVTAGDLRLLDIRTAPPAGNRFAPGSSIPIYFDIVNVSGTGDTLTGATSGRGVGGTVQIVGSPPAGTSATATAGTSAPATASPLPTATSASGPVRIPASGTISLNASGPYLVLTGFTHPQLAGTFFPIQLTFEQAGAVSVQVAVTTSYPETSGSATP